ncbi:MAG TPA: exo-beta-N-acetylmuramidase NamZ domain-containing protein [Bryobacteraceae bacterium]|nr:exo-beta-N-acetylmuramidase NamZ domain-containing protein [Bryobacteraceae bacterium]
MIIRFLTTALFCTLASGLPAAAQTFHGAADLDAAINQAIREDKIPGAVVLVGHNGEVVYRKAYGNRALVPAREPMSADTIFDIASLTKIVATTSAMMKLFEQGRVHIDDPVTTYLPGFQGGASAITVRDLMTHYSGLRPDLDLEPEWSGYETGIQKALVSRPDGPPEAKFVYSDINFILTGEIVHRVSGMPENEYVKQILFDPLGMKDTGYLPPAALKPRIAPTEMQKDGSILRGVVHDPTARYMGGVAGHAGVFSTADDLGKFCQMILDGGDGLFSPATIRKFTSAATPVNQKAVRGLGWDIDSPYSGPRGDLFPVGSFGHTGFTGTSMWLDPASRTYVILMTNSVHPTQRKAITPLRRSVATIVAASIGYDDRLSLASPRLTSQATKTGLDVLEQDGFRIFRGKKIGLITNDTGVDRLGKRNVDVMKEAGIDVVALFAPEHGLAGAEDRENLADTIDAKTGIKVWSLYGKTRRPTPEMLRGLDALVFDIQDVGVRFYTYESTMLYAMEEAARAKLPLYVLDRPNPITGIHVEGPMLDADKLSFAGAFPLPLRHGMTIGELAGLENGSRALHADLHVIQMTGWRRDEWFDATGLPWVNPSPNIRNLNEALLYPGIGMLEYSTNYSVGRGTDAPFEQIGADWIRGSDLVTHLAGLNIPGVRFYPVEFTPSSSNFAGKRIEGVRILVTNRELFQALRLGLGIAGTLEALYPGKIGLGANKDLIGSSGVIAALSAKKDAWPAANARLQEFLTLRQKFLLYH